MDPGPPEALEQSGMVLAAQPLLAARAKWWAAMTRPVFSEGNRPLLEDETVLSWLRAVDERTKWTTSVCTGSLVLGAAGLLEGRRATSHWLFLERLREFGADPVGGRFVEDGKVLTAAGVSAGIDMALHLVGREAGPEVAQAIQLGIEYDPQPPYDAGSPGKAPAEIVEAVTAVAAAADDWLDTQG